jgi:hypothetical protein
MKLRIVNDEGSITFNEAHNEAHNEKEINVYGIGLTIDITHAMNVTCDHVIEDNIGTLVAFKDVSYYVYDTLDESLKDYLTAVSALTLQDKLKRAAANNEFDIDTVRNLVEILL